MGDYIRRERRQGVEVMSWARLVWSPPVPAPPNIKCLHRYTDTQTHTDTHTHTHTHTHRHTRTHKYKYNLAHTSPSLTHFTRLSSLFFFFFPSCLHPTTQGMSSARARRRSSWSSPCTHRVMTLHATVRTAPPWRATHLHAFLMASFFSPPAFLPSPHLHTACLEMFVLHPHIPAPLVLFHIPFLP